MNEGSQFSEKRSSPQCCLIQPIADIDARNVGFSSSFRGQVTVRKRPYSAIPLRMFKKCLVSLLDVVGANFFLYSIFENTFTELRLRLESAHVVMILRNEIRIILQTKCVFLSTVKQRGYLWVTAPRISFGGKSVYFSYTNSSSSNWTINEKSLYNCGEIPTSIEEDLSKS